MAESGSESMHGGERFSSIIDSRGVAKLCETGHVYWWKIFLVENETKHHPLFALRATKYR